MDGCGFCKKAKNVLADEIASGMIIIKGPSEAPQGVRGYPHFVNESNGKSHSGYAPKDKLFKSLEVTNEAYHGATGPPNHHGNYHSKKHLSHLLFSPPSNSGYRTLDNYNNPVNLTSGGEAPCGFGCRSCK